MDLILFEAAKAARKNAYVPYSHFAVGAAVRAKVMAEFGISHIELTNLKGLSQCVSLEELLPYGFTLKEKE